MARARTIKPGFFTNDLLGECEPLARILFEGLWCHADRRGRLPCRPRKLKAEILPYDDADITKLLEQLSNRGFVQIYSVDGTEYIQVQNFTKHQSPHMKEPESTIPAPGEHQTNPVPPPEEPPSSRALTPFPSPVSLNPSPGSDASASAAPSTPLDLKRELWRTGRAFLAKHGYSEKQAGSLLGKWRSEFGDAGVIEVLAAAEAAAPSGDVAEYIFGCLKRRKAANGTKADRKLSPNESTFAGFAIALGTIEREEAARAETDWRDDRDPSVALLEPRRSPANQSQGG